MKTMLTRLGSRVIMLAISLAIDLITAVNLGPRSNRPAGTFFPFRLFVGELGQFSVFLFVGNFLRHRFADSLSRPAAV